MASEAKKAVRLAEFLIDCIERADLTHVECLLKDCNAHPNTLLSLGYSPLHFAAGFENEEVGVKAMRLFLSFGADPSCPTFDEQLTPLHIAAMNGRARIVELLLQSGVNVEAADADGREAIWYAMCEEQKEVFTILKKHIWDEKIENKTRALILSRQQSCNLLLSPHHEVPKIENVKNHTPNGSRINYNFDSASPYYVNITHRRKLSPKIYNCSSPTPTSSQENYVNRSMNRNMQNIFDLTEDNLSEFSKAMHEFCGDKRVSYIKKWREKVNLYRQRHSLDADIKELDDLFANCSVEHFNAAESDLDVGSFVTAAEENLSHSNFIKSPKSNNCIVQVMEEYTHTDNEYHISFHEKRFLPPSESENASNRSCSSLTSKQLTEDFNTDVLRAELTNYGDPPGPITKSTKRLYLKRLIKYMRNPQKAEQRREAKKKKTRNYSLELQKTFRSQNLLQMISENLVLEDTMVHNFQQAGEKKLREGHAKKSFIYFLIDPRISDNLSAQIVFLDEQKIWQQFLGSIFYVGKGKSSRPYAHLYDALRYYSNRNQNIIRNEENSKLHRIIEIWEAKKGVVCLHVFHNLLPAEAYTREAAVIDCIGLENLTNSKRGQYYGVTQSWTQKMKKLLGVVLLYKALRVLLLEGEVQLMPKDLV